MDKLTFTITINAPANKVWQTLWDDITYRQWTSAFHEGSYAVSDWKEGSKIHFLSPAGEGMYAVIEKKEQHKYMSFKHLGIIKNFEEQPIDDETKSWSGALENYRLHEAKGLTTLSAELDTNDKYINYFKEIFPKALEIVKQIAEGVLNPAIIVTSTINAPVEKVWQLWTLPQHITKWNYASNDWHTPFAENDLRVGGKFLSRMEAKDGNAGFDFVGVYGEVKTNELLAYTISDGRKVKVTFSAIEDKTKVVETFEPESSHTIEMQRGGWQAILDNFKKYVESTL